MQGVTGIITRTVHMLSYPFLLELPLLYLYCRSICFGKALSSDGARHQTCLIMGSEAAQISLSLSDHTSPSGATQSPSVHLCTG